LGVLIGDGCFIGNSIGLTSIDEEIISNVKELLPEEIKCKQHKDLIQYTLVVKRGNKNPYINELKKLGLWGHHSYEKFIPKHYMYNSLRCRLEVLQGLLDTDGSVDKKTGLPIFYTTSPVLADNVKELIESIGGICIIKEKHTKYKYKNVVKDGRVSYCCYIRLNDGSKLFRLSRKKNLCKQRTKYFVKRIIDRVEYVGQKEAQCILIDSQDHLYLTNNFIVTHNTHLATAFAVQELLARTKENLILTRPIVEAGENLGFLPGTLNEKVDPYMIPLFDCISKQVGKSGGQSDFIKSKIEVRPLAYMRGTTFENCVCILDEAQNCSTEQLVLFLSRLGNGSKMIITGDPDQSDLFPKFKTPLAQMVDDISVVEGIGVVNFPEKYIVRHSLVTKILKRLRELKEVKLTK
jgi:hypothetical protein